MLMNLLAMAVAVLGLLRAVRSALYILAEIVDAGGTLLISVAWFKKTIRLLLPRERTPSAAAVKRAHGTHC